MRVDKSITATSIKGRRKGAIIKAYNEQAKKRLFPDKKSALYLIDQFNKVTGYEAITLRDYKSCGDCRLRVFNFWKNIISRWEKMN